MQPVIQQNQKKIGTVSFIDNKVRINYSDGTDSVLFEDISSISYKTIKKPNVLISIVCTFIGIIILALNFTNIINLILFMFIIVLGYILMFVFRTKHDNVIIETRGGKLLIFSVEFGMGKEQMENIESEKRKHS
jgi:hypothetical protein